jgi:hypothetical protein
MASSPNPEWTEDEMRSIDEWFALQDVKIDRPEAIRRLVELGLKVKGKPPGWNVIPMEVPAGSIVREADLKAPASRDGFMLNDADAVGHCAVAALAAKPNEVTALRSMAEVQIRAFCLAHRQA